MNKLIILLNAGQFKVHCANPFQFHGNQSKIYCLILSESNLLRTCPSKRALWISLLESMAADKLWHLDPLVFVNFFDASSLFCFASSDDDSDRQNQAIIKFGVSFSLNYVFVCVCFSKEEKKTIDAMSSVTSRWCNRISEKFGRSFFYLFIVHVGWMIRIQNSINWKHQCVWWPRLDHLLLMRQLKISFASHRYRFFRYGKRK